MKLQGIVGTGTGKLGSSVFSVSAGQQIVRQYQPNVSNPSTLPQVNNRAKMKLLAQLAAAVGSTIAIPKQGLVSGRNQFISKNYANTDAINGLATVDLPSLQLTAGSITIPAITAERVDGNSIAAELSGSAALAVNRVVYVAYARAYDGTLSLLDSTVITESGVNGTFPASLAYSDSDVVVYAYGMIDSNAEASAKYADYQVRSGEDIAYLIGRRTIAESDYLFTKTTGVMLQRDTTASFDTVQVAGVNIASSGNTSVPYAGTVQVNITGTDVDGLAVLIDSGLGTPLVRPFTNGAVTATVGQLAGGESIMFVIGEYDGQNFNALKTYGGRAVIASQDTTFSSVTVNGTAIGASGSTQVGQAASTTVVAVAANDNYMNMRVLVNGVARPFGSKNEHTYEDTISNLQIGDVLTFQLGHMIDGAFVVAATFGGSAVIAENPPRFNSVTVNGSTVASSGTTSIVAAEPNDIVISASNAVGKHVLVNYSNSEWSDTGEVFTGDSITFEDYVGAGDTVQYAIGIVENDIAVPQAIFGGTIRFIDAPTSDFSNVQVSGVDWNADKTITGTSLQNVSGSVSTANVENVTLVKSNTAPAKNTWLGDFQGHGSDLSVVGGSFNGNINSLEAGSTYWLVATYHDSDAEDDLILSVFEFSLTVNS